MKALKNRAIRRKIVCPHCDRCYNLRFKEASYRKRRLHPCLTCGNLFDPNAHRAPKSRPTDAARQKMLKRIAPEIYRLRTMPYLRYLGTEHWRTIRRLILERDRGLCRLCPGGADHVHHIHYRNRGREKLEDLVLLCRRCHAEEHEKYTLLEREDFWRQQNAGPVVDQDTIRQRCIDELEAVQSEVVRDAGSEK